jgi:hypothetical protein
MITGKRTLVILASVVLAGSLAAWATQKSSQSGFLGDYAQLKPSAERDGALYWEDRAMRLSNYKKFMVDPIVVHFAPNAAGTAVDPGELKELTDYFHSQTVKALSKNYQVVTAAGPGVLRVRAAITDINKTVPLANIHPGTKLTGLGLGGASMEAEAVDSGTNKRLAAVVETREGSRLGIAAGLSTFGHAKEVMDFWIERFVKRLDAAHGRKSS